MISLYISGNGTKFWYQLTHRNRRNAVLIMHSSGEVTVGLGILHRDNGPAVVWHTGSREWWIHGTEMSEYEYMFFANQNK